MGLLNKLSTKVSDYKLRRRFESAYNPDVTIHQFTSYLIGRVKKCVKDSVKADANSYEIAVRALRYLRNLVESPLSTAHLTRDDINKALTEVQLPYIRMKESLNLFDDAILLSMSGRYTTAFATLRSCLECVIVGAFYHGLTYPSLRTHELIKYSFRCRSGRSQRLDRLLDDISTTDPDALSHGLRLELAIENIRKERDLLPVSFGHMVKTLEAWHGLDVLEDPISYIRNEFYSPLSVYTHTEIEALTIHQYVGNGELVFDSGRVSANLISDFIEMFYRTLDIVGVIHFTVAKRFYQLPRARAAILSMEADMFAWGEPLTHTRTALAAALGIRRQSSLS